MHSMSSPEKIKYSSAGSLERRGQVALAGGNWLAWLAGIRCQLFVLWRDFYVLARDVLFVGVLI